MYWTAFLSCILIFFIKYDTLFSLNIFFILNAFIVIYLYCTSSGRAWKNPSASCSRSGWADPTVLAVRRPPPLPCTPATWMRAQDQVWRDGNSFLCSRGENHVQCYPNVSDGQRFYPTSPLRDYTDTARRRTRRRSHSACVRFKDARATEEDVRNSKPGFGSLPLATVICFLLVSSMLTSSLHMHLLLSFVVCLIFLNKAANDRQQRTHCLFNLQWLCVICYT